METIRRNTVCIFESIPVLYCNDDLSSMVTFCDLGLVVYNTVWYSYSAQWVKILSEGALSFYGFMVFCIHETCFFNRDPRTFFNLGKVDMV